MSDIKKIQECIKDTLQDMGFWVVKITKISRQTNSTVQIMIDNMDKTPITIAHCTDASNVISAILDVEDIIDNTYNLEVSTPGIDRPLVRPEDWEYYKGQMARVELINATAAGQRKFKGKIKSLKQNVITLEIDNATLKIEFENIKTAKLILTDQLLDFCKKQLKAIN